MLIVQEKESPSPRYDFMNIDAKIDASKVKKLVRNSWQQSFLKSRKFVT